MSKFITTREIEDETREYLASLVTTDEFDDEPDPSDDDWEPSDSWVISQERILTRILRDAERNLTEFMIEFGEGDSNHAWCGNGVYEIIKSNLVRNVKDAERDLDEFYRAVGDDFPWPPIIPEDLDPRSRI